MGGLNGGKMARDLGHYYTQKTTLENDIKAKEQEKKRLFNEYEALKAAYSDLDKKYSVVDRAKKIEKQVNSKNLGANLQWRGKRKNDYDKLIDDSPKKSAKQFRKDVETFTKEIKKERDNKYKKWKSAESALNGFNGLYSKLRKIKNTILKLEKKGAE